MGKLTKKPDRLDHEFVRNVEAPAKGAVTYWDSDPKLVGFGLRVYSRGGKSFFLNYRIDGRERRYTIGGFPRWSVTAARDRAKELRTEIDRGHDPAGQKRERREAPTVQDLIDRYVEEHLPTKSPNKFRVNDEKRILDLIGEHLGKRTKVADVHDGDVRDMHRKITEKRGPVRANRIIGVCSKMFAIALSSKAGEDLPWRNAMQGNPCKGVVRNREEGRERFFGKAELERIAEALEQFPGVAADCVRLIMLTGCRPSEAIHARWPEFDKAPGSWEKPSAHTKQRKVHKIPLAPPAIELVELLRKKRKTEDWVFPGDVPGEPIAALWHVWNFVREHAQLEKDEQGREARLYDLRHTFASVGVGGGLGLPIIGRLLGHTQARTTQRYAHVADDPLRDAANKIGNVIAGNAKSGAEVIDIKG